MLQQQLQHPTSKNKREIDLGVVFPPDDFATLPPGIYRARLVTAFDNQTTQRFELGWKLLDYPTVLCPLTHQLLQLYGRRGTPLAVVYAILRERSPRRNGLWDWEQAFTPLIGIQAVLYLEEVRGSLIPRFRLTRMRRDRSSQ